MKVKNLFFFSVFCLASVWGLTSCNDDDAKQEDTGITEPLVLDAHVGAVLSTSAAIQVLPSSDEGKYYLHLFTDAEFQTVKSELKQKMSDLMAAHPEEIRQGGQTQIFDQLTPGAGYVVCVAPATDSEEGVKQYAFTTKAQAGDKLNPVMVSMTDWANSEMKGKNEFSMILSEAEYVDYMFETGRIVRLYGIRPLVEEFMPEDPAFFNGVYKLSEPKEEWTIHTGDCKMEVWENRNWMSGEAMDESEFALYYADKKMRIMGCFTIGGKVYEIDHTTENLRYTLAGYYGYLGYRPQLQEDKVNLDYTLMKDAAYRGSKNGVGLYSLACVHDPDPDFQNGGLDRDCLRLNLYALVGKYPLMELPSGTYTIDTEADPFTPFVALPGDYLRESSITNYLEGCYYYNLSSKTKEQTTGFLRKGTITVSRENGEYTIVVDAITHLGHKVSGTYKGKFDITVEGF